MLQLPDVWPEFRVHVCREDLMQPGLTLINLSNHPLHVPLTAAVIDARGETKWLYQRGPVEFRWNYTAAVPDMRGDIDVRTVDEGVLVSGTNIMEGLARVMAFVVSWDGEVLWENLVPNHHHIHRTPQGTYLFLTIDRRHFAQYGKPLLGDQIVEWDPATNSVVWNWHLFDHHEPESERADYSHSNTIEPDPRDDSLIVSCRNMNSLIKVDRGSGDIVWRLGVGGDFEMPPEALFYHQHAPELQPDGNILLFDNGTGRPEDQGGEFSRALELRISEEARAAEVAWEWRHQPDLYCPIWSDADRLPNGNTLIVFGTRTEGDTTRYVEVAPNGDVVWEVEVCPSGWGTYRAERIQRDVPGLA